MLRDVLRPVSDLQTISIDERLQLRRREPRRLRQAHRRRRRGAEAAARGVLAFAFAFALGGVAVDPRRRLRARREPTLARAQQFALELRPGTRLGGDLDDQRHRPGVEVPQGQLHPGLGVDRRSEDDQREERTRLGGSHAKCVVGHEDL